MKKEYMWLAGWYATKLHAVACGEEHGNNRGTTAICGNGVFYSPQTSKAAKKIAKGPERCKICIKKISDSGNAPSFKDELIELCMKHGVSFPFQFVVGIDGEIEIK